MAMSQKIGRYEIIEELGDAFLQPGSLRRAGAAAIHFAPIAV
jgi:hypothetical protein